MSTCFFIFVCVFVFWISSHFGVQMRRTETRSQRSRGASSPCVWTEPGLMGLRRRIAAVQPSKCCTVEAARVTAWTAGLTKRCRWHLSDEFCLDPMCKMAPFWFNVCSCHSSVHCRWRWNMWSELRARSSWGPAHCGADRSRSGVHVSMDSERTELYGSEGLQLDQLIGCWLKQHMI